MSTEAPSPNAKIDKALNALMKNVETLPPETAVKVIAAAIAWEKVKSHINETEGEFDPQAL